VVENNLMISKLQKQLLELQEEEKKTRGEGQKKK